MIHEYDNQKGTYMTVSTIYQDRLRLRNTLLKNDELTEKFSQCLVSESGVLTIERNNFVGSMLVIFDPKKITIKQILTRLLDCTGVDCRKMVTNKKRLRPHSRRRALRKYVKLGLAASIGGTIGTLAVSGKLHALAGSIFLCFLAAHNFQNRRTFFT